MIVEKINGPPRAVRFLLKLIHLANDELVKHQSNQKSALFLLISMCEVPICLENISEYQNENLIRIV